MIPPIHINTPVWGEAYTRCFLEIGLASLLSPGNLPVLGREGGHILQVMTTEADKQAIEQAEIWQRARTVINCRIDVIAPDVAGLADPHVAMSNCHREAIAFADSRQAAIVFYNPDIVIADGAFRTAVRLLSEGKRAIQVIGLRLAKDQVVSLLLQRYRGADGCSIVIQPRELVAVAMNNLHPLSLMHFRDAPPGVDLMPQEIFWGVGNEGLIARCFHIHPILVYPRVRNASFSTTVDDDYLRMACPDPSDEYVVTDSDEFCLCELSGMHRGLLGLPREGDISIARWASSYARQTHLEVFCRRVVLHSRGTDSQEWKDAFEKSDRAVYDILKLFVELRTGVEN